MRFVLPALGAMLLATGPVAADEVTDQIDTAVEYYEEGDLSGAVSELQFAIESIRALQGELYAETFPPAPSGWSADEVEAAGSMPGMGGQILNRSYYADEGRGSMGAELAIDSPMIQAMAMMLQNPAMLASQPNMERVRIGRENALLEWPGDGSGELTMMVGGRALVRIDGSNVADKAMLIDLMESWDFDALKEAAGL